MRALIRLGRLVGRRGHCDAPGRDRGILLWRDIDRSVQGRRVQGEGVSRRGSQSGGNGRGGPLHITHDEPIHICSGYILSKAREALIEEGYTVENVKIVGATQELAEREYLKSLVRLGVGDMSTVASMRSFNSFLAWVHQNIEARERYVKTGWSSWSRLREGGVFR